MAGAIRPMLIYSTKFENHFYRAITKWNDSSWKQDDEHLTYFVRMTVNAYIAIYRQNCHCDREFTQLAFKIHEKVLKTLQHKDEHYSRGDRYSVFVKASMIQDCSIEQALIGMLSKHIVSMINLLEDCENEVDVDVVVLEEKTVDILCYLILLDPILKWRDK
jgi:hypothetical protein